MYVLKRDGTRATLDPVKYEKQIVWACQGIEGVDAKILKAHVRQTFFDGIKTTDLNRNLERHAQELSTPESPRWTFVAAKFVLQEIYKEVVGHFTYPHLVDYLSVAVREANLNPDLPASFDLERLNAAIDPSRDYLFDYLGMSTIKDRYLLRGKDKKLIEMPQHWFMRVAMGVAIDELDNPESDPTSVCIDYYNNLFSRLKFLSSTPTLFNSGLKRSQLSSCFGISMGDDFDSIWASLKEAGAYSKYGGGVAMDYSDLRGAGAPIRSMGGEAGGPIPYIKLLNDTILGFDQQGKRKGVAAPYMETWHVNIENFLALREPGDDRVRAHDVFPSNWIPDLFMKRVRDDGFWSLFDPLDVPDLHDKWGDQFEAAYIAYEAQGLSKKMLPATDLWELMLTRLLAHGVFWHCYKDRINERYPLKKLAPVRSSNLCTEIALRSSEEVSFVCNLGSINVGDDDFLLERDPEGGWLWNNALSKAAMRGIRFLDSVITVGFVPSERGRKMQEQDRPLGMGVMGWTSALYKLGIDYESEEHVEYANEVLKQISVAAMYQSAKLAQEKGSFPTFEHSTWAEGILTHETLINRSIVDRFDLDLSFDHCPFVKEAELKKMVKRGMRNSTLLAIAPTATISNIAGVEQCTELPFDRSFEKKNLSGTFRVVAKIIEVNRHNIPIKTAYEVDHRWTVWAAAARQIWVCQSQSTNFHINTNKPDFGDTVDDLYTEAWEVGLKTTYYCYGQSEDGTIAALPNMTTVQEQEQVGEEVVGRFCSVDAGPECESCQ
jgi:ribonucleoside-diphosphate reductase alpha chain